MPANPKEEMKAYSFGDFTLDVGRGALLKDGQEITLRPQSYEVLRILVASAGQLVSREELQQEVWGHKVVTDDSLTHCLIDIRKALGDDDKKVIRTVPRRGFIFDEPVAERDPSQSAAGTDTYKKLLLGAAAVGVIAAAGAWLFSSGNLIDDSSADDKTIAVLPFLNLTEDPTQTYFSDGLTEEILNSLAKTPDLLVTARTSSFAYRDSPEDVPTIAAALGVKHILEGSVRRTPDRLRVTAQLIRAHDGFHLWSETFDSASDDIISIQENIAVSIAQALETVMDPEALKRMMNVGTRSVPAYEAFVAGTGIWVAANSNNNVYLRLDAQEWFEKAVELDPDFTRAYDFMFWHWQLQLPTNNVAHGISGLGRDEIAKRRDEALDNAIRTERDPSTRLKYEAHKAWVDMKPDRALQLIDQFLEENPEVGTGRQFRVVVLNLLRKQDRLDAIAKSIYGMGEFKDGQMRQSLNALEFSDNKELMLAFSRVVIEKLGHEYGILYRIHHILLNAGDIDGAREILPEILNSSLSKRTKYLAELRQACADQRLEDAQRIFAEAQQEFPNRLSLLWHTNKIMGYDEAAEELFREYDDRGDFLTMYSYLTYPHFDPKVYPNFMRAIYSRGIQDRPISELRYRCNRSADNPETI